MLKPSALLTSLFAASAVALGVAAGCNNDKKMSDNGMGGSGNGMKPLEGNPGATTNQSVGYPQSDPGAYHPQTDDSGKYHPANSAVSGPTTMP